MEEKKERFIVGEVTTQTQPIIKDTESEKVMDVYEALATLLNDVALIKKQVIS